MNIFGRLQQGTWFYLFFAVIGLFLSRNCFYFDKLFCLFNTVAVIRIEKTYVHSEPLKVTSLEVVNKSVVSCRETLERSFNIPEFLYLTANESQQCQLLKHLTLKRREGISEPTLLIIHVQHGLGNRLRALCSGLTYAEWTQKVPIVIWERDEHMGSLFTDLYEDMDWLLVSFLSLVARDSLLKSSSTTFSSSKDILAFDYMQVTATKRQAFYMDFCIPKHIYWKSAYVLNAINRQNSSCKSCYHQAVNSKLQSLSPKRWLQERILETCPQNITAGFHIRHLSVLEEYFVSTQPHIDYGKENFKKIEHYRQESRTEHFCFAASVVFSLLPNAIFYVAADSPIYIHRFLQCLQSKLPLSKQQILPLVPMSCKSRSNECIQNALIDLYCLSHAQIIFGSPWSSFTEVAHRLSLHHQPVFYAGKDFVCNTRKNQTTFLIKLKENVLNL